MSDVSGKRNIQIDLMKFILAAIVVADHVRPFDGEAGFFLLDCIGLIVDPMFFVFTAYFFFDKVLKRQWKKKDLGKYLKRIGILYGIWVLFYLPRIWSLCMAKSEGWKEGLRYLLQKVFLAGPYGALWFLTALLLAMPLTFFLGKRLGGRGCAAVAVPFYLFTTVMTMYGRLGETVFFLQQLQMWAEKIFEWLANGLTYGFFFCSLGLLLAEESQTWNEDTRVSPIVLLLAVGTRFLECYATRALGIALSYGAGLSQIFLSYIVTKQLILQGKRGTENKRTEKVCFFLSQMSILIFTLHYGVMELFRFLWKDIGFYDSNAIVQYLWVLGSSCAISALIVWASKKPKLQFLKCLY